MSIEAMKQAIEAINEAVAFREGGRQKAIDAINALRIAIQQAESEPVAWRELCRRLYVELFYCDQQMQSVTKYGKPVFTQGSTVRDVLRDAKSALESATHPAPGVPDFSRIAKRKLDELQERGFAITGYAIQRGPVRGFIDGVGFVGWWQGEPDPGVPDDVVRDAERYRWLRDRDHWPAPFASSQDPEPVRGIDLDAAIDAAMLAASPAQKGGE